MMILVRQPYSLRFLNLKCNCELKIVCVFAHIAYQVTCTVQIMFHLLCGTTEALAEP